MYPIVMALHQADPRLWRFISFCPPWSISPGGKAVGAAQYLRHAPRSGYVVPA